MHNQKLILLQNLLQAEIGLRNFRKRFLMNVVTLRELTITNYLIDALIILFCSACVIIGYCSILRDEWFRHQNSRYRFENSDGGFEFELLVFIGTVIIFRNKEINHFIIHQLKCSTFEKRIYGVFFSLCHPLGTRGYPQRMYAILVQVFEELQLTYKYICAREELKS